MSASIRLFRVARFCATLLLLASPAIAQQEIKTTPAKEVATNPQRFWARGVVFRDVLVEPPAKETITIAGARVYKFTTKVVGTCYADEQVLAALQALDPGRDYIFGASVFSQQTGLIRKKTRYRVVINSLVIPAQEISDLPAALESTLEHTPDDNPLRQELAVLKQLIVSMQEALTAMAATEQIDRSEYLNPKSEYFDKLIQASRRAINDLETDTKTPGREHLAQILAALVALEEGALAPAQPDTPPPTEALAPESQPAEDAAPAPEPTEKEKSGHWFWPFGGSKDSAPSLDESDAAPEIEPAAEIETTTEVEAVADPIAQKESAPAIEPEEHLEPAPVEIKEVTADEESSAPAPTDELPADEPPAEEPAP